VALTCASVAPIARSDSANDDFVRASRDFDLDALTALAHTTPETNVARAAGGILAALHGDDDGAIHALSKAAVDQRLSADQRFEILQTLADVDLVTDASPRRRPLCKPANRWV
jgi:hypothetical protein